jgi:hypothetical protein
VVLRRERRHLDSSLSVPKAGRSSSERRAWSRTGLAADRRGESWPAPGRYGTDRAGRSNGDLLSSARGECYPSTRRPRVSIRFSSIAAAVHVVASIRNPQGRQLAVTGTATLPLPVSSRSKRRQAAAPDWSNVPFASSSRPGARPLPPEPRISRWPSGGCRPVRTRLGAPCRRRGAAAGIRAPSDPRSGTPRPTDRRSDCELQPERGSPRPCLLPAHL